MPKAIVLGAGLVGTVMALDMAAARGWRVTLVDSRPAALKAALDRAKRAGVRLETAEADLSSTPAIRSLVADQEVVLGALSSRIAFGALQAVVEAGKAYADISFMPEDATDLHRLAVRKGATAVVDIGVAPGMSHVCAAEGARRLSRCENIEIYVGGLPRERRWPFDYKAAFSPYDVIEEYTRPARLVERGRQVVREALSEPELMEFEGVGTLESFNTDGLRSLVASRLAPNMKEKTLRYPGHIDLMRAMRQTGLFSEQPIIVDGQRINPRAVTAALMFPKWSYGPGEEDLTVMRIIAEGLRGRSVERLQWDLLDFYHRPSGSTSMARTTAFPCTIAARMLADGSLQRRGVLAPESLPKFRGVFERFMREHRRRGVIYRFSRWRTATRNGR